MLNHLPIQVTLPPGEHLVLWQSRMPAKKNRTIPIIEILPENHTAVKLDYNHLHRALTYNQHGMKGLNDQKGKWIDLYC